MEKVVLTDGESVEIVVAKGAITIDSNGFAAVDGGTLCSTLDLFGGIYETYAKRNLAGVSDVRFEPTKADKMQSYLYMLFEAQKAKHDVHKEIGEALKEYKAELGI